MSSKTILAVATILLMSMMAEMAQDVPQFEVPIGFSMVNVHPNQAGITSFNLFGGGGGFVYNISPLFGIKADFMGYTQGSGQRVTQNGQFVGNVSGNLFTYLFGPQIKKHSGKFQPFGEALFGARIPTWMRTSASYWATVARPRETTMGSRWSTASAWTFQSRVPFNCVPSKWTIYTPTLAPTTFKAPRAARTTSSTLLA